ncbi:hypothetical protein Q1695_003642 [Nippostrongylus brasiliensis]|nr:hypothetical protein Q1695_003642 [Nippostrongylus brasiliensis]
MLNVAATLAFLLTAFVIHSECSSHFGGHDEVHDEAHIKQHLEDKIDVSKMTEEQQRFYYFSMSDLNKDNFIDGTEILKALTHDHSGGTGPGQPVVDEESYITMVDGVLKDMDFNGDGYIDFSQKKQKQGS